MKAHIAAQINNMVTVTRAFCHSCAVATIEDDGSISLKERIVLKRINDASEKYIKTLEKLKKES